MKIRINKLHFPVSTLGPGQRLGIWFQGCHIHCPGCVSQDTWDENPEYNTDISKLLDWVKVSMPENLDGITISGGEPFDQSEALYKLLEGILEWRMSGNRVFDVLCYSGLPLRLLNKKYNKILSKLDAIIPEPYVDNLPLTNIWRGSSNQSLIALSPLGKNRYKPYQNMSSSSNKSFQVEVAGDNIWCIGIPGRQDMEKLKAAVKLRGVDIGKQSWSA